MGLSNNVRNAVTFPTTALHAHKTHLLLAFFAFGFIHLAQYLRDTGFNSNLYFTSKMTDQRSFWDLSPGPYLKHYLKSLFTEPKVIELLPPVPNRPLKPDNIRRIDPGENLQPIVDFWYLHFKGRGIVPITDVSKTELEAQLRSEHILIVAFGPEEEVIGTVMSAPLGSIHRLGVGPTNFRTRWIDFFCVKPSHRGRGLGSSLLNALLDEQKAINEPASFFLKEGAPLNMPSFSTSTYVWRKVGENEMPRHQPEIWTHDQLYTYCRTVVDKTRFFINSHCPTNNTVIYAWRNLYNRRIIISISESAQIHPQDRLRILWQTGFISEPGITEEDMAAAAKAISCAAARHFGSHWVWMDSRAIGTEDGPLWKADGYYHIYAFHMDTGIYLNAQPTFIL